jgi:hypothetical protein
MPEGLRAGSSRAEPMTSPILDKSSPFVANNDDKSKIGGLG